MKIHMIRKYDRINVGPYECDRHIGLALCRNANAYAYPANEAAMKDAERAKIVTRAQLEVWCKAAGVEVADGALMGDLREALLQK